MHHFNKLTFTATVLLIATLVLFVTLAGCNAQQKNPLQGRWVSEKNIMARLDRNYKEVHLEFNADGLSINQKMNPVIYKIKPDRVEIFFRGEHVTAEILSPDKIILFLPGIGKRIYIRVK